MGLYVLPCHWVTPNGSCSCALGAQCEHKGKHPRLEKWQKDASSDPEQIKRWWKQWPRANVGINTGLSGLVAVDVDSHSGGFESLRDVVGQHGSEWLNTWNSSTPRDGEHFLFRCPEGVVIPNSTGTVLGPGIDIKATGGQVVEYPSRTENGLYMWNAGQAPGECELLPLPSWLLQKLTGPAEKAGPVELRERVDLAGIYTNGLTPHQRNNELTRAVGVFRHYSFPQDLAEREALRMADESGLPREEALKVVRSVYSYPAPAGAEPFALEGEPPAPLRFTTLRELASRKPPQWLVEGLISEGTFALLTGKPGGYKSFTTLGLGLSVATGRTFAGHWVAPGPVVYVAGEGVTGLYQRALAWLEHHNIRELPDTFHVLEHPIQMMDAAEVVRLEAGIRSLPQAPRLVIIDTLARSLVGGDENSARDVGKWIAGADHIRRTFGCTVLVVHHTGKAEGATYRGSSALEGAADTWLSLSGPAHRLELKTEKQKDAEALPPLLLTLIPTGSSLALEGLEEDEEELLTERAKVALQVLRETFGPEAASIPQWTEAMAEAGAKVHAATVRRAAIALTESGLVERVGSERRPMYRVITLQTGRATYTQEGTPSEAHVAHVAERCTDTDATLLQSTVQGTAYVATSSPPLEGGKMQRSGDTHASPPSGCDCSEAHKGQPVGCGGRPYYMTKGPEGIRTHCHQCHPWVEGDSPLYEGNPRHAWD